MPIRKILPAAALLFVAGAIVGGLMFPAVPSLLLPGAAGKYILMTTRPAEAFTTRLSFSACVGLACSSAAFSSWVIGGRSRQTLSSSTASFMAVTTGMIIVVSLYYRNRFAALSSMLDVQAPPPIALDAGAIPYCTIPLIGAVSTCAVALICRIYKTRSTPSTR